MSLLARFTETRLSPELKARLRATQEQALTQLIARVVWVALVALVAYSVSALQSGDWGAVIPPA